MQAYRLRHRITIQVNQPVKNPTTGAMVDDWQTATADDGTVLVDVPADVLTGGGREHAAANTQVLQVDARINLRWFPMADTALAKCRILWDGRVFDINGVTTDITARREWRLTAKHGVNNG